MERTISGMMGKGSVKHNTRAFSAKNVDEERSIYNVEFCHEDIKKVYHELFDEALERYNAKQKRSDRKIDDYYEKIRQSRQEKLFHEAVFQIGNKDDTNARSEEGQLAKEILTEFMQDFQKRNPNLYVFSAHLHMDEETPHVHVDFVPYIHNSKRGLDTRVSLKGALSEQGFKGGTRSETEWNQWMESEKQELSQVAERYGVKWKHLGTHNKHLSVLDFEKQERQKEVAELEQTISGSKEELSDILHQQTVAGQETERIQREKEAIQREVDKMARSKEVMERNIHAYDEDDKWQLPEPGTLMSAKAYRDKKALPLVKKLKEIVKSLTIKCIQLADQVEKLTANSDKMKKQISRLTDKVAKQGDTIEKLQEKAVDYGRLERYIGREQAQMIVERSKALEQAEVAAKRPKRSFGMSR